MINFTDVFFLAFAFLVIVSALMVIISKNPIQSALYLVLAFFGSAGLWIMLNAEFLGLMLILVYVGAVMTLFLFVVMTVNFSINHLKTKRLEIGLSILLVAILVTALLKAIGTNHYTQVLTPAHILTLGNTFQFIDSSNTQRLGSLLYTDYVYPFEIAGVLLLSAIIAAISLRGNAISRNRKVTDSAAQINVNAKDRLKIIKMTAVQKTTGQLNPTTPTE